MIGIPLGLAVANAGEWLIHKHVLHGLGKRKGSFWSFHWHEHHRACRQQDHLDPAYQRPLIGGGGGLAAAWNAQSKEALALVGAALAVLPLLPVAPFFTGAVLYSIRDYHRKHKRAHLDPSWARAHLPWHYDHHMGPSQDKNWCVTRPWLDDLLGTREVYLGTAREVRDRVTRAAKARSRASAK